MIEIDIPMPSSCADCPMCHCKGKDEPWNYCCFATMDDINIEEWDKERYITCPLKEVPDKPSLKELLPTMRGLTPEEREAMNKAIKDMCYDTGVTLQGLMNHETYIPKSVLEDIKAELDRDLKEAPYMYDDEHLNELYGFQDGIEHAIRKIDSHISGKENI